MPLPIVILLEMLYVSTLMCWIVKNRPGPLMWRPDLHTPKISVIYWQDTARILKLFLRNAPTPSGFPPSRSLMEHGFLFFYRIDMKSLKKRSGSGFQTGTTLKSFQAFRWGDG